MIVFLNGRFVPESEAVVSVFDRGFLYGDGLFETVRVTGGKLFRWPDHVERLRRGAEFLKIELPLAPEALRAHARELIQRNQLPDSVLRISVSRGVGVRGYSPKGADRPTVIMALHPAPDAAGPLPEWRVITATLCLPADAPLAQFKTCNKLSQVLARAEADAAGADEALLLNTRGQVVEATSGNLFWIREGCVCTSPLNSGILPGVTRLVVREICESLGSPARETSITPLELRRAEGIFLSLSSWGIIEIVSLDGCPVARSPLAGSIRDQYRARLAAAAS